jgi:uncharacterized protein (TIGR02594 family)
VIHPWLTIALEELATGVAEIPGPDSNPRIREYLVAGGGWGNLGDDTPWCAAFVSWCLERSGLPSTNALNARSYLAYGVHTLPQVGCITVLWRIAPSSASGHVGFLLDRAPDSVVLLGGNQGDRVSVQRFPIGRVLDYRMPAVVPD